METHYKLIIVETGQTRPGGEDATIFNEDVTSHKTLQDVKDYLFRRYDKHIKPRRKIYVDTNNGTKQAGWRYSFWNKDWSHNSKCWFQTDWIELWKVHQERHIL